MAFSFFAPRLAKVTGSSAAGVGALGESHYQGVPFFSPVGYSALPAAGTTLLLMELEGSPVAVGSENPCQDLAPGEVRIVSAGGAVLELKNTGEISLNGLIITPQGEMIPPR